MSTAKKEGEARVLGDPNKDWWEVADIAVYLQLGRRQTGETVDMARAKRVIYGYRYNAGLRRKAGESTPADLPEEDEMVGRTPRWRPKTIIDWDTYDRPGQGVGGGAGAHQRRRRRSFPRPGGQEWSAPPQQEVQAPAAAG